MLLLIFRLFGAWCQEEPPPGNILRKIGKLPQIVAVFIDDEEFKRVAVLVVEQTPPKDNLFPIGRPSRQVTSRHKLALNIFNCFGFYVGYLQHAGHASH